jgi:hypothetical protein
MISIKNIMSKSAFYICLGICICSLSSCKSEYTKYVEREMSKGIRNDSLIFGLRIGQPSKAFFDRCTELNKQQLITEGEGSNAKYIEPFDSLGDNSKRKEMQFYGLFDDKNNIYGMRMTFSFLNWALWSESTHSDKLMIDIKEKMMKDYGGNEFIEVALQGEEFKSLVKIDGNRRIIIVPKSKEDVYVKIEDLNYVLKKKS